MLKDEIIEEDCQFISQLTDSNQASLLTCHQFQFSCNQESRKTKAKLVKPVQIQQPETPPEIRRLIKALLDTSSRSHKSNKQYRSSSSADQFDRIEGKKLKSILKTNNIKSSRDYHVKFELDEDKLKFEDLQLGVWDSIKLI